ANLFQSSALLSAVNSGLQAKVQAGVQQALTGTTTVLENAFLAGISKEGAQTLFDNLCTKPIIDGKNAGQIFDEKVTEALQGLHIDPQTVDIPCAPDPTVHFTINNIDVGDHVACDLDFQNGQFTVKMNLPDVHFEAHAFGENKDEVEDVCIDGVTLSSNATINVTQINLSYVVTEDNLLHNTFSA